MDSEIWVIESLWRDTEGLCAFSSGMHGFWRSCLSGLRICGFGPLFWPLWACVFLPSLNFLA